MAHVTELTGYAQSDANKEATQGYRAALEALDGDMAYQCISRGTQLAYNFPKDPPQGRITPLAWQGEGEEFIVGAAAGELMEAARPILSLADIERLQSWARMIGPIRWDWEVDKDIESFRRMQEGENDDSRGPRLIPYDEYPSARRAARSDRVRAGLTRAERLRLERLAKRDKR